MESNNRKFVRVVRDCDGAIFCEGIFDDFYEALEDTLKSIKDFGRPYRCTGDFFEVSVPHEMGEAGIGIDVTYKTDLMENECTEFYGILFCNKVKEAKE